MVDLMIGRLGQITSLRQMRLGASNVLERWADSGCLCFLRLPAELRG